MIYKYYIDIDTGGLWRSHKDEGASVYTSTIYEHFISTNSMDEETWLYKYPVLFPNKMIEIFEFQKNLYIEMRK